MQLHQDFGGAAFAADQLQADRFGASAGTISVGQVQSLFEFAQSTVIQIAVQHHFVGLVHFEAGVGESVGQFAVVGQQQHPGGIGVETADWEQAHAGGMTNQINRPWSPSRVGIGADHALRLPQHDVDQSFPADGFSIDQDAVLGRVHKDGKGTDRDAIDFDRPFFNEGLTRAA